MVKADSSVTVSEIVIFCDPITLYICISYSFAILYCNYLCIAILSMSLDCELLKGKDLIVRADTEST